MSKNSSPKKRREPDQRTRRTHHRLGTALLELILERPMDEVTVQDVLDRACIGRSTFYLHFRDKDDLLLSQLAEFCEVMSTALSARKEKSTRLAPVTEMFGHIASAKKLYRALADSGRIPDFFDLAETYFTRGIARRLKELKRLPTLPQRELDARASLIAGSLLSLLRWWLDHGSKEPPEEMDALFHRFVWNGVRLLPVSGPTRRVTG